MNKSLAHLALLATALGVAGCGAANESVSVQRFEIALSAVTDGGEPLSGVQFASRSQRLGVTAESGRLDIKLSGSEGKTFPISATCPKGFAAPEKLPALRLATRRAIGATRPQPIPFEVVCTKSLRDYVLVVHTNQSSLPVIVDGQTKAATDADGNAHVALQLDRSVRSVNVTIDTSGRSQLKPLSPSRTFELDGRDAVLLVGQDFSQPKARVTPRPPAAPERHIPYRLD